MKPYQPVIGLVLVIGISVSAAGRALSRRTPQATATAGGMPSQSSTAAFPKDVYAETGNRLPPLKREDLDDAGKKLFDLRGPSGDSFGPGPITAL